MGALLLGTPTQFWDGTGYDVLVMGPSINNSVGMNAMSEASNSK
jgi:hypothetical protein